MQHLCDVLIPPDAQGSYGELIGNDGVYLRNVPISIEHLSGREGEVARATFAAATHKVRMYGDPKRPLGKEMKLKVQGFAGDRLLEIADIKDIHQNGTEYELICGEQDG